MLDKNGTKKQFIKKIKRKEKTMSNYNSTNIFFSPKLVHPAGPKDAPFTTKSGEAIMQVSIPPREDQGRSNWSSFTVPESWIKTAKNGNNFVSFNNDKTVEVSYQDESGSWQKKNMTPQEVAKMYELPKKEAAKEAEAEAEAEADVERD